MPVRLELLAWTGEQGARLSRAAGQAVEQRRQRLRDLSRALPKPATLLDTPRQRLDLAADRLPQALIKGVQNRRLHLAETAASLRPSALRQLVQARRDRLDGLGARLTLRPVSREFTAQKDRLGALTRRLEAAQRLRADRQRQQLAAAGRQLEILSYRATLARGYAVVRDGDQLVTSKAAAAKAKALEIEFADGTFVPKSG